MMVAGFGFRSEAGLESLLSAYHNARIKAALPAYRPDMPTPPAPADIKAIATADDKARSPAFQALARQLGLPIIALSADQITTTPTYTQSTAAQITRGTGSLAEAAALAGITLMGQTAHDTPLPNDPSGPHTFPPQKTPQNSWATLIAPRMISDDRYATCALAYTQSAKQPLNRI